MTRHRSSRLRSLAATALLAALATATPLAAQTHLVLDAAPGPAGSSVDEIAILGDLAVFATIDPTGSRLRTSDGTTTTTIFVFDTTPPFGYPTGLTTVGSRVVMAFGDATTGTELWASDGTAAGTGLVTDIRPGPSGSSPRSFGVVDGVAYFSAAVAGANHELWRTDGSAAGTWQVAEIHASASAGSNPAGFAKLGASGAFVFAATDGTAGRELWRSDGTAAGTTLVKDIVPGAGGVLSSAPEWCCSFGDRVAFEALGQLWVTDGTAAGTVALTSGSVAPKHLAVQNGTLFFQGADTAHGAELWASDGTSAGTAMLAELYSGGVPAWGSFPSVLTPIGSRWVYFAAFAALGEELWRTDGVVTELFDDIAVGSASSSPNANSHWPNPRFAVTGNGRMFFVANDGVHGAEPFVFDTGVLASTATTGLPCGGLALTTTIPHLDSTVTLTTGFIPVTAPLSLCFLSLSRYAPPLDLAAAGMPGCTLHCPLDAVTLLPATTTGSAVSTLGIPDDPALLGLEVHAQSASFVPGVNAFGAITSNGVTMTIGDL
jgi:ELWxxDGT repeat protein